MKRESRSSKSGPPSRRCESCAELVPVYDMVSTGGTERPEQLCTRCFNAGISVGLGLEFTHPVFEPFHMQDPRGRRHEFHFRTLLVPSGLLVEAFELEHDLPGGYTFCILGDFDADPASLMSKLLERMRRALQRQHLLIDADGNRHLDTVVRGRITMEDMGEYTPAVVIDGETVSWHEFGEMLLTYEGFQFKLDVVDRTEEV